MNENYEKLIQPSEFADDEPVEFAAVDKCLLPSPIEEKNWVHISERLWARLLSNGASYGLHFHQVIEPVIDTVLNSKQCEAFAEELEFLAGVANDPAFLGALSVVRTEVSKVVNRQNIRLVISPP